VEGGVTGCGEEGQTWAVGWSCAGMLEGEGEGCGEVTGAWNSWQAMLEPEGRGILSTVPSTWCGGTKVGGLCERQGKQPQM
jgi:hypothetical protein